MALKQAREIKRRGADVSAPDGARGPHATQTFASREIDAMRLSAHEEQHESIGRVLMTVGGVISLQLDPPSFSAFPLLADPVLLSYAGISLAVLAASVVGYRPSRSMPPVDLAMGLAAVAVTGGTGSPLFFYLLLPVISVAFHYGFERGATVTMLATLLLMVVGLPTSAGGVLGEPNRAVLRPFSVLILGYLISRHGELQSNLRRRLSLLADLSMTGTPLSGIEQAIEGAATKIRRSYGVSECILAYRSDDSPDSVVVRATRSTTRAQHLPKKTVDVLMRLSDTCSAWVAPTRIIPKGAPLSGDDGAHLSMLRDLLGALPFLTLPLAGGTSCTGRLFLLHKQIEPFDDADEIDFLRQLGGHLMSIIQRIDLHDHLASLSARKERQRLAHDLHDMAIQPYLGLQLALAAALKRQGMPVEVKADLQSIAQLAQQGATELRRLLSGERASAPEAQTVAVVAIGEIARQAPERFGIDVVLEIDPGARFPDRLTSDLLALVTEALSNIRRHTQAKSARIAIVQTEDRIVISVSNTRDRDKPDSFRPQSIAWRVEQLGGRLLIDSIDALTVVTMHIPL